jgi:hypothetical protein
MREYIHLMVDSYQLLLDAGATTDRAKLVQALEFREKTKVKRNEVAGSLGVATAVPTAEQTYRDALKTYNNAFTIAEGEVVALFKSITSPASIAPKWKDDTQSALRK